MLNVVVENVTLVRQCLRHNYAPSTMLKFRPRCAVTWDRSFASRNLNSAEPWRVEYGFRYPQVYLRESECLRGD